METAGNQALRTLENRGQGNEQQIEHVDSRWYLTTKYPQIRRRDPYREDPGIRTVGTNEPGHTNRVSNEREFNLGLERTRQRNALRNEIYAQVLSAKMEAGGTTGTWETGVNQILRAIDQLPATAMGGRVYVCQDGEMGIVWEDESRRVEISTGVSLNVEYLIWEEEGNINTESEWDVGGGEQIPPVLKEALLRRQ